MDSLIEIQIRLYGMPEWEFELPITIPSIMLKGNSLQFHLQRVTEIIVALVGDGWDLENYLHKANCVLTKFTSRDTLIAELGALGIQSDEIQIYDFDRAEQVRLTL
ncbi:MAG: hypothetical protein IH880_03115 [Candidatus Marinimicrobia bacterium]|nr:hypothetical protein [Candidatus Neomarinimicrobiota bacterium]